MMKRNVYQFKGNFKSFLFILAILITLGFVFYTQSLVQELQQQSTDFLNFKVRIFEENINNEEIADLNFFFSDVIQTADYPIIYTDPEFTPQFWRNVKIEPSFNRPVSEDTMEILKGLLTEFQAQNRPIPISYQGNVLGYYFYGESEIIRRLRWLPFIEIFVVAMFILIGYAGFSSIKRGEQRFIWVGMAKETAHQLGTPLSSQIGWLEYLKSAPEEVERVIPELEKDLYRLQTITSRFSQIGSQPETRPESLEMIVEETVNYFRNRLPSRNNRTDIKVEMEPDLPKVVMNRELFSWVLENLIKNGLDALESNGGIITLACGKAGDAQVYIDVSDSGKGIPGPDRKNIFKPGFSTKKRGWGLGLSLSKRIVEEYHDGKLSLKESQVGAGSRFRILLNSQPA